MEQQRSLFHVVQDLQRSVDTLTWFLGAIIPAWTTELEVERGDDMGLNVRSATDAGLVVEIVYVRDQPGLAHGDVVRMEPAAGTMVPKGSTVTVTMNLKG